MPPKRRADDITSHKPKKILKVDESDERKQMTDFDKKKREELEHALDREDNDRVLKLGLEFMDWQMTSSNLAKRLQCFFVEKATNHDLVRKLLQHQNPHLWTPVAGVLLWQAVKKGQIEIAKMLVQAGTDLSLRESTNNNTILHAVLSSEKIRDQAKKENLVLLMLEHGADIDAVDKNGDSILNRAIRNKASTAFIERLLQLGANVRIEDDNGMNDIYYALECKPELVLRLIQHQVPNKEARNRRGVIAIEYLISTDKYAEKLKMIKSILNLGVPINNPDPRNPLGNNGCSLLHSALHAKKIDVIKLLLENGADVHQKDEAGITPLYKAALVFKGFSHASRLLIGLGASINKPNSDGRYPIHGACENESLRNVHLFLSVGANLAVTDDGGFTPFDSMTVHNFSLTDAGRLVIKHFALLASNGLPLIDTDLIKINEYHDVLEFFNNCLEELNNMKTLTVCDDIPYFCLLSENLNDRLLAVKNANFVKTFKENPQMHNLFLIYFFNLKISFEIAVKQLKILKFKEEMLKDVVGQIFPIAVIEKIAYYVSLENMMECEKLSFLALHENAKHNKLGKRMLI